MGSNTVSFSDVADNAWYATAVKTLASHGIIGGYADGTYKPGEKITRAEFATIASNFDKLSSGTSQFSDVTPEHWAYKFIVSAATKGWINGYPDGTFRPDNNITRGEVVALLNSVLGRSPDKKFIDKNEAKLRTFPDVPKTYWNYYGVMEAANGHEYIKEGREETWTELK